MGILIKSRLNLLVENILYLCNIYFSHIDDSLPEKHSLFISSPSIAYVRGSGHTIKKKKTFYCRFLLIYLMREAFFLITPIHFLEHVSLNTLLKMPM